MRRSVLEVIARHGAFFRIDELAVLCWAAWRRDDRALTPEAVLGLLERHLAAGGVVLDVQQAVTDALIEARLIAPAEDAARPRMAGTAPVPAPSPSF